MLKKIAGKKRKQAWVDKQVRAGNLLEPYQIKAITHIAEPNPFAEV